MRKTAVLLKGLGLGLATLVSATSMAPAQGDTSGTVTLESTSIAIGVGVSGGDGALEYRGQKYPFTVKGLSIMDLGVSKVIAGGVVQKLNQLEDFDGNYVLTGARASVGGEQGEAALENQNGVADGGMGDAGRPGPLQQAVGAAVTAIAVEALDVGQTLLEEGELRERLPRLQQQWEHLQPWLTPECVSAARTTSINSLIGAATAADTAERLARAAEGRMAALTVLFGTPGGRPVSDASRLELNPVESRRDDLDVARRDLHAAWRTLKQTREGLAGAVAEAESVAHVVHYTLSAAPSQAAASSNRR
jgi:hypothetical protein